MQICTFLELDRLSDLDLLLLLRVSVPLFSSVTSSLRVLFVVRVDTFPPLELGPPSFGLASTPLAITGVPPTLSGKLGPLFNWGVQHSDESAQQGTHMTHNLQLCTGAHLVLE